MKLIIAGGPNYHFTDEDYEILNVIIKLHKVTEIVHSGESVGAYAKEFANDVGLVCKEFLAEWQIFGHASAGPIRNKQMVEYADAVLLFSGGMGTKHILNLAKAQDLKIFKISDFKEKEVPEKKVKPKKEKRAAEPWSLNWVNDGNYK